MQTVDRPTVNIHLENTFEFRKVGRELKNVDSSVTPSSGQFGAVPDDRRYGTDFSTKINFVENPKKKLVEQNRLSTE